MQTYSNQFKLRETIQTPRQGRYSRGNKPSHPEFRHKDHYISEFQSKKKILLRKEKKTRKTSPKISKPGKQYTTRIQRRALSLEETAQAGEPGARADREEIPAQFKGEGLTLTVALHTLLMPYSMIFALWSLLLLFLAQL